MKDITRLQSEEFESLLSWFSDDREKAAEEYLEIHAGLVKFFRFKGCSDSQSLADETFNRVAKKVSTFEDKNVKKITIFYGFASNIFLEYLRDLKRKAGKLDQITKTQGVFQSYSEDEESVKIQCLSKCLGKLSSEERDVFIEYYRCDKGKKAEIRRNIAERLQCEMNTLQVRIFRLRKTLRECLKKCIKNIL